MCCDPCVLQLCQAEPNIGSTGLGGTATLFGAGAFTQDGQRQRSQVPSCALVSSFTAQKHAAKGSVTPAQPDGRLSTQLDVHEWAHLNRCLRVLFREQSICVRQTDWSRCFAGGAAQGD